MLSQKSIYISIIAVLSGVVLALCMIVFYSKNNGNEESVYSIKNNLQDSLLQNAEIGHRVIADFTFKVCMQEELIRSDFLMVIPPSPCDACVMVQEQLMRNHASGHEGLEYTVLSPEKLIRDTIVFFSEYDNVHVIEYSSEILEPSAIDGVQGVILCTLRGGQIDDVFITNAIFPQISSIFLGE